MPGSVQIASIFPQLLTKITQDRLARVENLLERYFSKALSNTADGYPFIITGDIPAMWLRDSTWQVRPFLQSSNAEIQELLVEISKTQVKLFSIDPYANAFNPGPTGNCWEKDFPDQDPWVFERKYELDSWASILFLARKIKEVWGISAHLDKNFDSSIKRMLDLAEREQRHDKQSYRFHRSNGISYDSLSNEGFGPDFAYTGMVYSAFRPSDDACTYPYLVPANLFFLNELRQLDPKFNAKKLADEIQDGISQYAISEIGYAYEVDGHGNKLYIDDANVPSLLSLPYLEVCAPDDPVYLKTLKRILSSDNPFFFEGTAASGIGSRHTPDQHIWPIAIAMKALASTSKSETENALRVLESCDAGTGQMHESFHKDDPATFTREWFSWADMVYLELVLKKANHYN
jgi:meiotically up-regulated gene 157 (Mug157) protein